MVILCMDCAEALLLSEKVAELKSKVAEDSGETTDLVVECMECGREITAKIIMPSSPDLPAVGKLKRA